ncbi:MAG: hypothetical protein IPJ36_19665 [Simplicispira sp.]|nr:hypothetical protein [Simplicispira sp.]
MAAGAATFKNLSGKSAAALSRFFKIAPEEIRGARRTRSQPGRPSSSAAAACRDTTGCDIHAQLGSGDYWRLRIGTGTGDRADVAGWVLKRPRWNSAP